MTGKCYKDWELLRDQWFQFKIVYESSILKELKIWWDSSLWDVDSKSIQIKILWISVSPTNKPKAKDLRIALCWTKYILCVMFEVVKKIVVWAESPKIKYILF